MALSTSVPTLVLLEDSEPNIPVIALTPLTKQDIQIKQCDKLIAILSYFTDAAFLKTFSAVFYAHPIAQVFRSLKPHIGVTHFVLNRFVIRTDSIHAKRRVDYEIGSDNSNVYFPDFTYLK